MLEGFLHLFARRSWSQVAIDVFDVLLVTFVVYRALLVLRGTRAMQMGTGLGVIFVGSTIDFAVGKKLGATEDPRKRKALLLVSVVYYLGVLSIFKYFNFAVDSVSQALALAQLLLDVLAQGQHAIVDVACLVLDDHLQGAAQQRQQLVAGRCTFG